MFRHIFSLILLFSFGCYTDASGSETDSVFSDATSSSSFYSYTSSSVTNAAENQEELAFLEQEGAKIISNRADISEYETDELEILKKIWDCLELSNNPVLWLPLTPNKSELRNNMGDFSNALMMLPTFIFYGYPSNDMAETLYKRRRNTQRFGKPLGVCFACGDPKKNIYNEEMRKFFAYLPHKDKIQIVILRDTSLSEKNWASLATPLMAMAKLKALDLSDKEPSMRPAGFRSRGQIIQSANQLRFLRLQNIDFSKKWTEMPPIANWPTTLQYVDLKGSTVPINMLLLLLNGNYSLRLNDKWLEAGTTKNLAKQLAGLAASSTQKSKYNCAHSQIDELTKVMGCLPMLMGKLIICINDCEKANEKLQHLMKFDLSFELKGSKDQGIYKNRLIWENFHDYAEEAGFEQKTGKWEAKIVSNNNTTLVWNRLLHIYYDKRTYIAQKSTTIFSKMNLIVDCQTFTWDKTDEGIKAFVGNGTPNLIREYFNTMLKPTTKLTKALKQLWPCLATVSNGQDLIFGSDINCYGGITDSDASNLADAFREVRYFPFFISGRYSGEKFECNKIKTARYFKLLNCNFKNGLGNVINVLAPKNEYAKTLQSFCILNYRIKCSRDGRKHIGYYPLSTLGFGAIGVSGFNSTYNYLTSYSFEKLATLNLGGNGLKDKDASNLATILYKLPAIKYIYLDSNMFGPNGLYTLSSCIRNKTAIEHFTIRKNRMYERKYGPNNIKCAIINLMESFCFNRTCKLSPYYNLLLSMNDNLCETYSSQHKESYDAFNEISRFISKRIGSARTIGGNKITIEFG